MMLNSFSNSFLVGDFKKEFLRRLIENLSHAVNMLSDGRVNGFGIVEQIHRIEQFQVIDFGQDLEQLAIVQASA